MRAEEICFLDCLSVGILDGMRPDLKKKSGFFKCISQQFLNVISGFFSSFRAKKEGNTKWLKLAIQTKIQLCDLPKFDENHHFRSRCGFHTQGQNEACGQALESLFGKEQGGIPRVQMQCCKVLVAINMDKSGNRMPRGSYTMNSNQLFCGRGVPCKDEGLEKGNFLKPRLANYNYIL